MQTCEVITKLGRDGTVYEPGETVELPEDEALALSEIGVVSILVSPVAPPTTKTPKGKAAPEDPTQPG